MKMTRFEKSFVNRKKKSERNIEKVESDLELLDLKSIQNVLELGCGIGYVSSYLAETYNFNVYGTDYDLEQIHIAEKIQPKVISGGTARPSGPEQEGIRPRGFPRSVARGGNGFWLHVLFADRIRASYLAEARAHPRRERR